MARGVNKVILIGNLGKDPQIRYSQGGNAVTNFSVATNEQWKDKQSGEQQSRTEWHNVVCFGQTAEVAGEYLRAGSPVYIEGKLQTDKYEKDGVTRYSTKIIAQSLQMLGGKQESGSTQSGRMPATESTDDDFDDGSGIPF